MALLRIIPRLDIKSGDLIKSVKLEGLRKVGDPVERALRYYLDGADELIINDPIASLYGIGNLKDMLRKITDDVFIPVCASGGISGLEDVYNLFEQGADKVALNSVLFSDLSLLSRLAKIYGSQSIVGSVEIKKVSDNNWQAFYHNGREPSGYDAIQWINILQEEGVGELLVTSIDNEGMKKGFDLQFLEALQKHLRVPIIVGGGLVSPEQINQCMQKHRVNGVSLAGFFHYSLGTVSSLKAELKSMYNVDVR